MTFSCQVASQSASVRSSNADLACRADVVDEAVDRSELPLGFGDDPGRLVRLGEVGGDAERGSRLASRLGDASAIAPGHDDAGAFGREEARGLEPDAGGRAGDEADAIGEPKLHSRPR